MNALSRQRVFVDADVQKVLIVYRASKAASAIQKATELRGHGMVVELMPERIGRDYEAYAEKNGIQRIIYAKEEGAV